MPTEMKSSHQGDAPMGSSAELDPGALAAIRDLISTEAEAGPAAPRAAQPPMDDVPVAPAATMGLPAAVTRPVEQRASSGFEPLAPQESLPGAPGLADRVKAKVLGYRPTPKHMMVAAFALLVLLRPGLVFGILFLAIFAFVCFFLIVGYDGFWQRSIALCQWYARRRPGRAEELHRKLDSFALKWDAFLDRFPEGTVDWLYLPDFEELTTADSRHDEALNRRFKGLLEKDS